MRLVQNEFEKVQQTGKPRRRKPLETLGLIGANFISLVLGGMVLFKLGYSSQLTSGQQTSSLGAVALFSLLVWGGRLCCGMLPVIRARRIRDAILFVGCVTAMLWWIIFLKIIAPGYGFTKGQFIVAFLWAYLTPGGALIGWASAIETAARLEVPPSGS